MPKLRQTGTNKPSILDAIGDSELSQEAVAQLEAAEQQKAYEVPPAEAKPVEQPPAEQPPEQVAPLAAPDAAEAEPKKPASPAQERIRELVAERNAERDAAAELRERWARTEERVRFAQEAREHEAREQAAAAEAARRANERPDQSIDPVGAQLYDLREQQARLLEQQRALLEQQQRGAVEQAQQHELAALGMYITNDLVQARIRHPDYDSAANYATQARIEFWTALGKQPQEAKMLVEQEALAIAAEARRNGKSAGDIYYDVAKRWGYQVPTAHAQAAPAPKERLAQIAKGQALSGLSDATPAASGTEDIENMTIEDATRMSDDEFARIVNAGGPRAKALLRKYEAFQGLLG